ncbi:MAG: MBL fold metallo-hydrolase [Candidatus Woesearchaeota archaeon]
MVNKLTFLGTAGDYLVLSKQTRYSGGIAIECDDLSLILNPGPGSLVLAKQMGVQLRDFDAILATDTTFLHSHDVGAVASALTHGGLDSRGVVVTYKEPPQLSESLKNNLERLIVLPDQGHVALNDVDIRLTTTGKPHLSGVFIRAPKFHVSFVGDTAFSKSIAKQHQSTEILLLSVTIVEPDGISCSVDDAISYIQAIKPKVAVLCEYGQKVLNQDLLELVRFIQKETKVHTIAAKDGLVLNPVEHAATVRQQKLHLGE